MPNNTSHPQASHNTALANRAVALAALVQSTHLVERIARTGMCDVEDFDACIRSIFAEEHYHVAAAYGGLHRLQSGLHTDLRLLRGEAIEQAKPVLTYSAGLMALEKRLARNQPMLTQLAEGIGRIKKQSEYFGSMTHDTVIAALAGLYGETLSTLKPRIIVRGKQTHLQQKQNTNRVRALLLAGIRAAHLWRKHGGGHLRLLLGRHKLAHQTELLLQEAKRLD